MRLYRLTNATPACRVSYSTNEKDIRDDVLTMGEVTPLNKPRVWNELSLVPQGTLSYPFFLEDGAYSPKRRVVAG